MAYGPVLRAGEHGAGAAGRFASLGVQPVGDTPEQFGAVIRADLARWSKVIKSAGVKVE
jgi:tripartite-type tricarboxylate transporter receptor subunit TctC